MRNAPRRILVPVLLLAVLAFSMVPVTSPTISEVESTASIGRSTPIGQATGLTVGSWPDGANERVKVSVDDGHAVNSIGLSIKPSVLPYATGWSWTDSNAFGDAKAVYDGMDVNQSSLKLLPQDWLYDFESGAFEPEWTLGGSSNWAIQSGVVLEGTKTAKAGSISHNQESRMVLDVSQLPASTGSFRYSVSSESSFDYLLFCIDNTGCSRFSGYTQRWSGTVTNNTQTFTIPATAQTLTWKYTKDGSVNRGSDTAWVDEILIVPTVGSGDGEGNWTSPMFGPSLEGRGESTTHGMLHMDAYVFPGSVFEWQVLDALTGVPVPGFEHMTATTVDLGMIDHLQHPLLRLSIHMKEAPGGGTSEVRSISMNGQISKEFDSDPTSEGWQLQGGSWSNGVISSSGTVVSAPYTVRSGFSAIHANNDMTGPGQLEYSIDGGNSWTAIGDQEHRLLSEPAFLAQFRVQSTGGTFVWDAFEVELIRTSVPDGLRIDIDVDGVSEWSMNQAGLGPFGLQNQLLDGQRWRNQTVEPASPASFEVGLPLSGVHAFGFEVAAPSGELTNPFMAVAVNGQDILSRTLPNINDLTSIMLTTTELSTLNSALGQAVRTAGPDGVPLATVQIRVGSSLSSSTLLYGGIVAPYDANVTMQLNAAHPLVIQLNNKLAATSPLLGTRTVSLPVRMDGTGAVYLTIDSLQTQASVKPLALEVANVSDTLVPGNDWVDATSGFSFEPLSVTDALTHARQSGWEVELQLIGERQQSRIRCPVSALPISPLTLNTCSSGGTALLWFDQGVSGSISVIGSGSSVFFTHRFNIPDGWDDEASAMMTVNLIAPTGPMLPVSAVFGLGSEQGVENDIELKQWSILSPGDVRSSADYPYLQADELVNVEVRLGFEGVAKRTPRSGQALIRFLVDGSEYATTSVFQDGVALFTYQTPAGRPSVVLGVEVVPLRGQDIVHAVPLSHTFLFDNVAPTLMSSSVERFDSRDILPQTLLEWTVSDRPHLPTHAKASVWRSWVDDLNGDGVHDASEIHTEDLVLPSNLSHLMGDYVLAVDTSQSSEGDYFLGYLQIADSAGHIMEDGGSLEQPMFHVQLNSNGAPSLGAASLAWPSGDTMPWLHPSEWYSIEIPVWEQNGIYDLAHISVDLAHNTPFPAVVSWNQDSGVCQSSNVFVEVEDCLLLPSESDDLFSRNGVFQFNFTVEWGYDPDTSVVRVPKISMMDHSGQSNRFILEALGWRFSGELTIDRSSVELVVEEQPIGAVGYWVKPRTTLGINGQLVWAKTGTLPTQTFQVEMQVGENKAELDAVNGSFSGAMLAPLTDGTYGLFGDLVDAPNGAVYRGEGEAFVWVMVDNEAPRVTAVDLPGFNSILTESMWEDLTFEIRLSENARLNAQTLQLHWSLNEAGLGLNSYVFDNGSVPLVVLGERMSGSSIPVRTTLNLDELMLPVFRTKPVELRIWVTGEDRAGHEIDSIFNDVDAPLRVWRLEQRVPEFNIAEIELKPGSGLHQGDVVEVATLVSNTGLADGEANIVLELVESSGARTRIDARVVSVQSGEQVLYQFLWKPGRDGTQWLEMSIINGPHAQSPTVFVDEPRVDGVLGTIGSVNPVLLGVVILLVAGLLGLLVFGLRHEEVTMPKQVALASSPSRPAKTLASLPSMAADEAPSGPYGASSSVGSPGENPYQ